MVERTGEREREREREVGCGLTAKELLRLRSFSNAVVIYSYGSFGVAHAHGDPLWLSVEKNRWMGKREREEGGTRKLRGDSHRATHTIERDTLGSRVRTHPRMRSFLRLANTVHCVDPARDA